MTDANATSSIPDLCEELPKGTELMMGQYTITDYLNHGGFGITYLAKDSLNRQVVVKECFPGTLCRRSKLAVQARSRTHMNELQGVIKLFMREAHALSKLEHPNIVGVHQVFEDHGTAYMVLDFIEGTDMLPFAERTTTVLPAADIKDILEKILDAIGFVHSAGMLHRDISPDNIILTSDKTPMLIDFGAAREQASKATQALSALRVVKDGYSPQEFYLAGSEQGPSSDLYSLAATFYHIITGETPPDSQIRLTAHVGNEPDPYIPLGDKTDAFDSNFCEAIDKALAVLPKDRLQSAAEWKKMMQPPAADTKPKRTLKKPSRKLSKLATAKPQPKPRKRQRNGVQKSTIAATVAAVSILAGGAVFGIKPDAEANATAQSTSKPPVSTPAQAPAQIETARVAPAPTVAPPMERLAIARPAPIQIGALQTTWHDGKIALTWSLDVPFTAGPDGVITQSNGGVPANTKLVSVNGTSVSDDALLATAFDAAARGSDGIIAPMEIVVADVDTGEKTRLTFDAPVIYQTELSNGLRVETRAAGEMWVTTVVATSGTTDSGLQVGDELIAVVPENTRVLGGDSFASLIAEAIAKGQETIEFALRRNGTLWTAEVNLSGETG